MKWSSEVLVSLLWIDIVFLDHTFYFIEITSSYILAQ